MKNFTSAVIVLTAIFTGTLFLSSCKKDDTTVLSVDQVISGHWNINRMQLRLYYNGVFTKDTIIKQTPKPENYVSFASGGAFEYRFNTNSSDVGSFELIHGDSVIAYTPAKTYRWKVLTAIPVLLTTMTTGTDPAFPGATVETYYTLVK